MRLLLATKNRGKVREILSALAGPDIECESLLSREELPDLRETGSTFAENARLKAEHYHRLTGMAALADDSGLLVDALSGRPGVHSARFASDDRERIGKLLRLLEKVPDQQRTARFVAAMCLYRPEGIIEVTGEVKGLILREPRGNYGFGYDPVFYYAELDKTFAELRTEEKNRVSHRARALAKLRERL